MARTAWIQDPPKFPLRHLANLPSTPASMRRAARLSRLDMYTCTITIYCAICAYVNVALQHPSHRRKRSWAITDRQPASINYCLTLLVVRDVAATVVRMCPRAEPVTKLYDIHDYYCECLYLFSCVCVCARCTRYIFAFPSQWRTTYWKGEEGKNSVASHFSHIFMHSVIHTDVLRVVALGMSEPWK